MTREQEAAIVRKVLKGDTNAFETLVLEYEKNVYNIALRMTGNSEDASDMTQEAFIKAFNSLQSFRGDSKFSVWLYRIVSNVCLDFLRSRNRRPTVSLSVEDDDGEDTQLDVADESQSPELLLDRKLTRESVRRGLDSLPPDYRQILLLREIQGFSYEEISKALHLEVGTVKSRIFRARKRLCSFLINDGNIPEFSSSGKMKGGESQ
ncbi:MAG: sigma-70 family RNA polymerase sigma factor [Candidatus Limivicinus sp.]|nr:sigma-70 family RNA polymerase sigma factor [Clostridiales bacterium]MDY3860373.1 sigma-70 family RNA polymerase sigma factor [Candidatus Limivicinus sp.]